MNPTLFRNGTRLVFLIVADTNVDTSDEALYVCVKEKVKLQMLALKSEGVMCDFTISRLNSNIHVRYVVSVCFSDHIKSFLNRSTGLLFFSLNEGDEYICIGLRSDSCSLFLTKISLHLDRSKGPSR